MKKLLSSAFSLLTSVALLNSAVPLAYAADGLTYDTVEISADGESFDFGDAVEKAKMSDTAVVSSNYNYEEGAYNLGYYLDDNNAAVYMALMKLINPSMDEVTVTLPEPLVFESTSSYFDMNTEEAFNAVFGACRGGIECASFDIPELFWLNADDLLVGVKSVSQSRKFLSKKYTYTVKQLTIDPAYYPGFASFDEVFDYKEKLEEAVENFEVTGSTRYEQIKCIHDKISKFTYYDTEGQFSGSCLGSLVVPGVVCEGYSKGFKLICDRLGIPCVCIFGNYDVEKKSAHMWNYVQMDDGKWYGIDVTWDDYDGSYGYDLVYTFFLKGSESFFKEHTESTDYGPAHFTYPVISKDNYDPANAIPITTTPSVTTTTTTTATTTTTTTSATTTTAESTTTTEKPNTTTTSKTSAPPTTSTSMTSSTTTTSTSTTSSTTTASTSTTSKPTSTSTSSTTSTTTEATSATSASTTVSSSTTETTTTTNVPEKVIGDVNGDGILSVADLVRCANHVLGKEPVGLSGDINDDKVVDVFDVVLLRKLIVFKINEQ